ncbi:MAG TPA: peptidyl-prolyl cis-trans isomerase [Opitutales bacterium]|nr:peptidyl-prolyl cis-trans isomerase [Opitutales bacterium]
MTASGVSALAADTPAADSAPVPALATPPAAAQPPATTPAPAPAPAATPAADSSTAAPVNSAGLRQDQYTDAVAAVVNGKIITMAELNKECRDSVARIFNDIEARYPPTAEGVAAAKQEFTKEVNDLGAEMLHTMVDHILIVQYFNDKGYSFPDSYLDWQFDDDMMTSFQGDREKYLRYLQAHELTDSDYRRQLKERDIVDSMIQQLRGSMTGISPDRIKAYYEQHKQDFYVKESMKLRRITLNLTPVADATPDLYLQQAAKIAQEARQPGASFAALAKQYSTDPDARSGDLPAFTVTRNDNMLAPALQDAVFKLKPGEISDPLVSDKLIFIFKCEDHTPEGYLPLDKVRSDIEKQLSTMDERQATEKWLQKLRSKAFIQYNIYGPPTPDK